MSPPRIFVAALLLPLGLGTACATAHETLVRYRAVAESKTPMDATLRVSPQGCLLDTTVAGPMGGNVSMALVVRAESPETLYIASTEQKLYAELERTPSSERIDLKPLGSATIAGTSCARTEILRNEESWGEVCIANLPENPGCESLFYGDTALASRLKAAGIQGIPLALRIEGIPSVEALSVESRSFKPTGKSLLEGYRQVPMQEFMQEVLLKPVQQKLQDVMEGVGDELRKSFEEKK